MPGPGPHMMYTLGSGQTLMSLTNGRFSAHHCVTYAINAFFGPDIGSFFMWLTSTLGLGKAVSSLVEPWIHDPFTYVLILGLPFSVLYSWVSKFLLQKGLLDSSSGVPLTRTQCFCLIAAGSLSHFFLDHLFEENGHSKVYTWVLSTGWWEDEAPINPDAVIVICVLCISLFVVFIYINRVKSMKSVKERSYQSLKWTAIIASLYALWCASQVYLVNPRRPAVGEEADLGVIIFLVIYFFTPHWLCIISMNPRNTHNSSAQLPL